jgi:hypothetical protein
LVLEAEYNIRKVTALSKAASSIDQHRIQQIASEHDAIAALPIANDALWAT